MEKETGDAKTDVKLGFSENALYAWMKATQKGQLDIIIRVHSRWQDKGREFFLLPDVENDAVRILRIMQTKITYGNSRIKSVLCVQSVSEDDATTVAPITEAQTKQNVQSRE